jgi:uncharacterized OB-fold protein
MALKTRDETSGRYLPVIYPEEKPYWDAAKAGKLVLQRCTACGKVRFPIGPACPKCLSFEFTWAQMSGRGRVHNRIIFHKAWIPYYESRVPYAVVQVELDEGPRLTTNMPGTPLSDVKVGMPVEVFFEPLTPEITLPQFRPRKG